MAILSWMLTDEQYIARVRWFHRWRRVLGILFLCLGLGFAGLFSWLFWSIWEDVSEPLFSRAEEKSVEPANRDDDDSDHRIPADDAFEMADSARRSGFLSGMVVGALLGGAMACFLGCISQGIALFFRDRKTELLLRCLDEGPEAVGTGPGKRSGA